MASERPSVRRAERDETAYEMLRSIRKIVRRISEHSRAMLRESGLTVPQLMCLRAIGDLEGREATVATVSRQVQLAPATVSRILDRLERSGLVVRKKGRDDRRKVSLSLTPTGAERYRTLPTPLQEEFLERFGALDASEKGRLQQALDRVVELMEATEIEAAPLLAPGHDIRRDDEE